MSRRTGFHIVIMSIYNNTKRIFEEIELSCEKAGRNPQEITLVAASKYSDAAGIREAFDAGIRHFGENRVQAALEKMSTLPEEIHWHMIGHLQKNKVAKVVGRFELIHSVDSAKLAEHIDRVAAERKIVQRIMLEVNTAGEESKFGLAPAELGDVVGSIVPMENIELVGFMTMAPFTDDEGIIRDAFGKLRRLRDRMEKTFERRFPFLSMGMTNDWRIAIEEGATHLRIGSAIFRGD